MQCESVQKTGKHLLKGALNLTQNQHQNGHGDHMRGDFQQFCRDSPHDAFALCEAESSLNFNTLVIIPVVLHRISGFTAIRASQRRTGEPYPMRLAVAEAFILLIDLVRKDPCRVVSLPFSDAFSD